tara:strand:- start:2517 stop:2993 length:477 start_codon:yes stop_codon:yes gene_type:complete
MNNKIFLRNLNLKDINKNYLSWFKNIEVKKFIIGSNKINNISELKNYFLEKKKNNRVLFLAILNSKRKHIGNIKFEPKSTNKKKIYMGILIGDKNYTDKGLSKIIFQKSVNKFIKKFNTRKYYANVHNKNKIAVKAYLKNNFKIIGQNNINIELVKYL